DTIVYQPLSGVFSRSTTRWTMGVAPLPGETDDRANEVGMLTYTTEPLASDTEVTGPITMELFASSTFGPVDPADVVAALEQGFGVELSDNTVGDNLKNDVQWVVNLQDVAPDGASCNITSGWLRASCRESYVSPASPEDGVVYRYVIEIWPTCNVFKAGHRIRVDIGCSDVPHFMPMWTPSVSQVYHDAARPSRIILPVVTGTDPAQWLEGAPTD
ncbi:MAG: CocE/NonD family hydrolase C-terminal non-catalytic domain-containing protein, partial [Candidatus Geothermincolia bacterium]